jgi:hypothetical protein
LAVKDGWELSDLTRSLVVLSAIGSWFGLRREENAARLLDIAALKGISTAMERAIHGSGPKRSYALRRGGETEVLTLILPVNLADFIELHAKVIGLSKNALCRSLLTKGLVIYLRSEKLLIEALRQVANHQETRPN